MVKININKQVNWKEWANQDSRTIAKEKVANYFKAVEEYKKKREVLFKGLKPRPFARESKIESILSVLTNFTRIIRDSIRHMNTRNSELEKGLKAARIKVKILNRKGLLKNKDFMALFAKDSNKAALRNLLDKEIYREIDSNNFLMIEGLTIKQFHLLIEKLGHNPRVFLSDPRGERLRFAIDNEPLKQGKHPFLKQLQSLGKTNDEIKQELAFWQPVFFGFLGKLPGVKKWRMSRTHGLVYVVKKDEKQVLLIPVHVDPKNAIVIFKELLGKIDTKKDGDALTYHQTAGGKGMDYVGTGLCDLGCAIFIKLLRKAKHKNIITKIDIDGEDKLKTRYSIYGDDLITWEIVKIYKEKAKDIKNPTLLKKCWFFHWGNNYISIRVK
ncbi:hypothetical protein AMJ49_07145 [Parcubacteria bacterium DG_74_2]|nr:MAG: hypothetical protein AMJ49_07145 [Parcubacteria bacterium DG_74_2]